MKILITGGCGFIGSYLTECFAREGHYVCIIDNLSSGGEPVSNSNYKFYNLDIADKRCEEIFRIHNFDIVVHLALQTEKNTADDSACSDSPANVAGLVNMLESAQKHGVGKFIFTSCATVYGNKTELPVREDAALAPVSGYGINKSVGEYYCRLWREVYGLNTFILRLSSVYGPGRTLNEETGSIPDLIRKIIKQEDIVIYGDENQTKDYIHVEEAAGIICRVALQNISEQVINVATNTGTSLKELLEKLALFGPVKNIRYEQKRHGDIESLVLDNSILMRELNWSFKHSLDDGLRQTYQWYQENCRKPVSVKKEAGLRQKLKENRPYLENFTLFAILCFLDFTGHVSFIDSSLGVDYNYIYIAMMGFFYGKNQSMIATVLSGVIFTANFLLRGGDLVALIYQDQYLFHLATYLCVGVVTGFAIDNKERIIKEINRETINLKERYKFLEKVYLETNQIKDELYGQIVNTDDSISRFYSVARRLDTLEMEQIYTTATDVARNAMKAQFASFYTVNKHETHLRLNTTAGENAICPNSLKIEDYPYLQTIMAGKRIFINKNMVENCPDMAAPILYNGKIFAVLQVHNLPFSRFNLFYENVFRITTMFITDTLIKAYLYSESIKEKRYLKNTNILITPEFEKILDEIKRRHTLSKQSVVFLRIVEKPDDYESFYEKTAHIFQDEDYIGLREDGHIYVLLINYVEDTVAKMRESLKNLGFTAEVKIEVKKPMSSP